MAEQINQNQIVPGRGTISNKYSAPPRDIILSGRTYDTTARFVEAIQNEGEVAPSPVINDPNMTPDTPYIIGVESQTVTVSADGKSVIDVVLNVTDVANTVEYDVRITKSAGNL